MNNKEKANPFQLEGVLIPFLLGLSRYTKRAILMSIDFLLILIALWGAYSLRLGVFFWPDDLTLGLLLLAAPMIGVLCLHFNGVYKLITRFSGARGSVKIFVAIGMAVLIWCLVIYMSSFTLSSVPRSVIVMFGLFSALLVWGSRHFFASLLRRWLPNAPQKISDTALPVIIYGVGDLGHQLAQELSHSSEYRLVAFIDDEASLWRQIIFGVRVYNPDVVEEIIQRHDVQEIILANPDLPKRRKRQLMKNVAPFQVEVKALSPLHQLASTKVMLSDLRHIGLDDLLGRTPVPPDHDLLAKTVQGKSVMITGAGGSIGSEIARQVIHLKPQRLVLYERSELALYTIEYELSKTLEDLKNEHGHEFVLDIELIAVLGSVVNKNLLTKTIKAYGVDTLYHAAAYKHVPLVEDNPFVGIENNVFGTLATAEAANESGVELFVLISTDKAVRPTNIMGASKRVAELCLQAFAAREDVSTIFTMVRFGNVLGSSGSVVQRFKEQIENGGPLTVTHPDIVRYFMMIPEAAQLVIQAGGMAKGGDVFVLDMGQPVKILDLARSMINLSGLEERDEANPDGDIQIEFIGLRDGEKLFEELLINENSSGTSHPSIIRNHEAFLPFEELQAQLNQLKLAGDVYDHQALVKVLTVLVEGYKGSQMGSQPSLVQEKDADGGQWGQVISMAPRSD